MRKLTRSKERSNLPLNKSERQKEGTKIWANYYRQNIHRFAKDFLGLDLKPFQDIVLFEIQDNNKTCLITSRGLGKSWILAVYMVCVAILYPGKFLCSV